MGLSKQDKKRFWSRVEIRGPQECWPWAAGRQPNGYGRFWLDGEMTLAHRVAWAAAHDAPTTARDGGPPVVRHTCDYRLCCNPAHLRAGTHQDNMTDMALRGRSSRGEAHARSKLTEEKVLEIRRLRAEGCTFRSIAAQVGVNVTDVYHVVHRRTWAWL